MRLPLFTGNLNFKLNDSDHVTTPLILYASVRGDLMRFLHFYRDFPTDSEVVRHASQRLKSATSVGSCQ